MGAAVGIASTVISAGGTIAGITAQKRQEQAQQDAIITQQQQSEANLSLRTQEIERQKLFTEFQTQVDRVNRESQRVFNEFENFAAEQQFKQQEQQLLQQQNEQSLLNQRGSDLQQYQTNDQLRQTQQQLESRQILENIQGATQAAQLGSQDLSAALQRQLGQSALDRQSLGEQTRFQSTQLQNQRAGVEGQAAVGRNTQQELLGLTQQNMGQQGQISGALEQIQNELMSSVSTQRDQAKAQALARVQLMGGATAGMSASDLALLNEQLDTEQTDFARNTSRSQRLIDQLSQDSQFASNLESQLAQASQLRGMAQSLGIVSQTGTAEAQNLIQNLVNSGQIADADKQQAIQLQNQLAQSGYGRAQLDATQGLSSADIQNQGLSSQRQSGLSSGLTHIDNIQQQLGISQQAAAALSDLGLSRGAQGLLASEQTNRLDLQNVSSNINQAFSEQALQAQLIGTQSAGASEKAALAAAQRGTGGGGLGRAFSVGSALLSGGLTVAGQLRPQQVQQPQITNPLFQQSSQGFLNRSVFSQPSNIPAQQSFGGFTGNTVQGNFF